MCAAYASAKMGYEVILLNKYPLTRNIGGGIGIWPNGSRVLIDLGLKKEVTAISATPREIRLATGCKELLSNNDIRYYQKDDDYPVMFVSRTDLTYVLFNAIKDKITYIEDKCLSIEKERNFFSIHTACGKTHKADVIVGAYGINSIVREYVSETIRKIYLGHISLGGIVSKKVAKNNFIFSKHKFCTYLPCANGQYYTLISMPMKKGLLKNYTTKRQQISMLKGWSEEVDNILDHLLPEHYFCLESYGISNIKQVAQDDIYLIGDAAHALTPISGLGTGLGMEDIPILMESISDKK